VGHSQEVDIPRHCAIYVPGYSAVYVSIATQATVQYMFQLVTWSSIIETNQVCLPQSREKDQLILANVAYSMIFSCGLNSSRKFSPSRWMASMIFWRSCKMNRFSFSM